MTQQSSPHQNRELLIAFGMGQLDSALTETVSAHLATCPECVQLVAGFSVDGSYDGGKDAGNSDGAPAKTLPLVGRTAGRADEPAVDEKKPIPGAPVHGALPRGLAENADYEDIRELGHGGMGVVYVARHKTLKRLEVLKVVNRQVARSPTGLTRFMREIEIVARLDDRHIVPALNATWMGDDLVLVMRYVAGKNLEEIINKKGALPVANAVLYAQQTVRGLQHAWEQNIVHRDIKPSNLMLAIDGGKQTIKIVDFGFAKAKSLDDSDPAVKHLTTGPLGTPHYISPEQIDEAPHVDIRADIYSLGCTLYHMLAGQPPFKDCKTQRSILTAHVTEIAKPLHVVRPEVPQELSDVVAKMMAKDPKDRYQTPAEVAKELATIFRLINEPNEPIEPPARRITRARAIFFILFLAAAAAWYSRTLITSGPSEDKWSQAYLEPAQLAANRFNAGVEKLGLTLDPFVIPSPDEIAGLVRSDGEYQKAIKAANQWPTTERKEHLKLSTDVYEHARHTLDSKAAAFLDDFEENLKFAEQAKNREYLNDVALLKIVPVLEELAPILSSESEKRIPALHERCSMELRAMPANDSRSGPIQPVMRSRTSIPHTAERYAGIDVGSRGVKFVMLEVQTRNGVRVPEILSGKDNEGEVKNSGLNDSAALTQKYSKEAMEATITAIKGFVEKARNQGVPDDHIFIVGSSGLQPARNREEFRGMVLAATRAPGHQECSISYISYEDEVAFTFLDVAPSAWRQTSWALDIGSGNTKFGYAALSSDNKWVPRAGQLRYATGTFRDSAIKGFTVTNPDDPVAAAAEFSDHARAVRAALKIDSILAAEVPKVDIKNRPRLYLSGGIVWALVTILKPEQIAQDEVKLTKADIEAFRERVRQPVDKIFGGVNLAALSATQREAADKDLKSVQKIFASYAETDPKNPDKKLPSPVPQADLIAGAEILDAVANTLDFDHLEILFPRKAVNAWIRSYVLFNADYQLVEHGL